MSDVPPQEELIFNKVRQMPAGERAAFLKQACAGDVALARRIDALLAVYDKEQSFLASPVLAPFAPTVTEPQFAEETGTVVGPYKLLEQIGEGGFGIVFMAEQQHPVRRKVALKVLKPGMDTRQVIARFEAERQALALMDHPHIAKVLDAGATESGRPFFVMELVKGVPITEYCDQHQLTPRERLELFVPVCHAVQHAHQKGIIHRDIKPSNVLVTRHDGTPVVKVIDFGVAKALGHQLTDRTLFTGFAQMIGTPLYMSPEQAELSGLDIDTRTDIYSLGVLLYELLTGTTPFDKERLKSAAVDEIRRMIREEEPPKPSTRLSDLSSRHAPRAAAAHDQRNVPTTSLASIAALRKTEPRKLSQLVRGDLDWIVMKALEKDRNRRYETANGFAMDVQRYLADEPVAAGPPSIGYRIRKFVRRNRGPVLGASAFVLLLAVAIMGTTFGLVRALKERDQKDAARRQAVAAAATEAAARRQTRQALNTLTDQVVEELLGRQAQLTERTREFLNKVLTLHSAFAAAKADDREGQESRVEGFFRVALIRQRLGEFKDAEAAYRDCLALYEQLAAEFPAEPDYRGKACNVRVNLGLMLDQTGNLAKAEAEYRAVLPIQKQLAAEFPEHEQYRLDVAISLRNLAYLLAASGRPDEAEPAYREGLAITKQLVADFPANPKFRREAAIGYLNLGVALILMGRIPDAETAFRDSLAVNKQLAADFPHEPDYRQEWATGHHNLGNLLGDTNRPEQAEESFRAAVAIQKPLAAEFPNRPDFRRSLAVMQNNLANTLIARKKPEGAEALFRDGVALLKQLAADFPNRPDFRDSLATTHNSLGNLLLDLDRLKEAEIAFRDALAIQRQLAADFPNVPDYRSLAAITHFNLGTILHKTGRVNEAEAALRDALAVQKQLAADFPKISSYQNYLAGTLAQMAAVHQLRREFAPAVALLEQARAHRQAALKDSPGNAIYRQNYREDLMALAESFIALADHVRLAATAEELSGIAYEPANDNYNAACFLCRCVKLAEQDGQLAEAKRSEYSQNYADRAMAVLRQAVARGYTDAAHMKEDSDLEPLRAREDFKKLLADLESNAKR
jgi:serine/threonine protein kinase/tetratricopeptide (TPR) repeat protein